MLSIRSITPQDFKAEFQKNLKKMKRANVIMGKQLLKPMARLQRYAINLAINSLEEQTATAAQKIEKKAKFAWFKVCD
mgnify:CR=1 FL=1